MEIKCTVEEFKELINETPVAGTTDVTVKLDDREIISSLKKCQNSQKANCDKLLKD